MQATLDGESVPMYTVISASPMQELKFKTAAKGMRTYLLVKGGIDVPKIMGSSSTFCDGKFGGHNGRALRTGDVLHIAEDCQADNFNSFDGKYIPKIDNTWTIGVLPGPQPTYEYLKPEYLDPEVVIPAPAQGVLAIETAEVNTELLDKINALSDDNSDREAVAERTFLRLTGGGCHAPVGAHCVTKDNGDLRMVVLFGNDDCSRILRIEVTGTDSEAVGHEAARMLGLE